MSRNRIKVIVLSGLAILLGLLVIVSIDSMSSYFVIIGQTRVEVDLAVTVEEHRLGLSGRASLPTDSGMLFAFNPAESPVFVMRSMNFPLDIIWISDGKVIKIDKNLKPEGMTPEKYYSVPESVNYVLEVNAGFSDYHHLSVGDNFSLERKNIF